MEQEETLIQDIAQRLYENRTWKPAWNDSQVCYSTIIIWSMAAKVPQWVCERAEKCTPVKRDFYLCTIHDRVPKPIFHVEFVEEESAFLDSLV